MSVLDRPILSPKAMTYKGKESPVGRYEVTEEAIRSFAQALEHLHPNYLDREAAKKGPHGTLVAPPTFIHHAFAYSVASDNLYGHLPRDPLNYDLIKEFTFNVELFGGTEIELLKPIRLGDVLTVENKIEDLYERKGKSGDLAFCVYFSKFTNQHGEIVATERYTYIYRR